MLAHELTHIINRDMLVMTIATFFSMVASLIVQNFFWIGSSAAWRRRLWRAAAQRRERQRSLITLLASVIVYASASS